MNNQSFSTNKSIIIVVGFIFIAIVGYIGWQASGQSNQEDIQNSSQNSTSGANNEFQKEES